MDKGTFEQKPEGDEELRYENTRVRTPPNRGKGKSKDLRWEHVSHEHSQGSDLNQRTSLDTKSPRAISAPTPELGDQARET